MFTFFKNEIPTTNAKCNFTTQMHTTEYLQNQNRLLLAFTGCLGDKYRERTAYFSSPLDFVLHSREYETLSRYAHRAAISLCFIYLELGANIGTTCLFPRQRILVKQEQDRQLRTSPYDLKEKLSHQKIKTKTKRKTHLARICQQRKAPGNQSDT